MGRRAERNAKRRAEKARQAELETLRAGEALPRPATIEEDYLDPKTSLAMELRALEEGWLSEADPKLAPLLKALTLKTAALGLKSPDPIVAARALRTVTNVEFKHRALKLQALGLLMRPGAAPAGDMPVPESPADEAPADVDEARPVYAVVQELIARREVRYALHGNDQADTKAVEASANKLGPGAAQG